MKRAFTLLPGAFLTLAVLLAACQPVGPAGIEQPVPTDPPAQQSEAPAASVPENVTVAVSGIVWNDQCEAEPGTAPDPMPAGCVSGALGAAQADGIRQEGELALSGVTVQVGLGVCPATGLAEAITDSLGAYNLEVTVPEAATICVSVDAETEANAVILMDGIWTAPGEVEESLAQIELTVPDLQNATVEFGWDFHQVGMSTMFDVSVDANCRSGPGTLYPALAYLKPGDEYPIVGRNQDTSWFMLDMENGMLCWASIVTGEAVGNTDGVQLVAAAPPPQSATAVGSSANNQPPACSSFTTQETCDPSRCDWFTVSGRGSFCVDN